MPEILCESNFTKLENIKLKIRCILISLGSKNVTLFKLNDEYQEVLGDSIPYKDFNFSSLKDFLSSMPDVVKLKNNNKNQLCAYHVDTKQTKHISLLKSKERKESSKKNSKSKKYNVINPSILYKILQELTKENGNQINKNDVMLEIQKYIGSYSFYTLEDLRNQLNEFLHMLTHNEKHIFLKNFNDITIQEKSKHLTMQGSKLKDKIEYSSSALTKIESSINCMIKDSTKCRLQKLIEKYPEGIWCSELPKMYLLEYKLDLEYSDMGFNSVTEFVGSLPNIFKIIIPPGVKKQLIVSVRQKNHSEDSYISKSILCSVPKNTIVDQKTIPDKLSLEVSKRLLPKNVMEHNDFIDQLTVKSLYTESEPYIAVTVSEIHNPSYFWITLRKSKKAISHLKHQMKYFYSQQNLDMYIVPRIILQLGLHVACIYEDIWHRGIIQKIKPDGIYILLYDYGTLSTFDPSQIYFLDKKFSDLPVQAIPCSFHNIKPVDGAKWSDEASITFAKKVINKSFLAYINTVDEKNNSMNIDLIHFINQNDEEYVSKWMVENGIADYGKIIYKISNFTFTYYQQHKQKECELQKLEEQEEHDKKKTATEPSISSPVAVGIHNSSTGSIRSTYKLEALKAYKAKINASPQSTTSSNNSINSPEQNLNKVCRGLKDNQVANKQTHFKIEENYECKDFIATNEKSNEKNDNVGGFSSLSCSSMSSGSSLNDNSTEENVVNTLMFKSCDNEILSTIPYSCNNKKTKRQNNEESSNSVNSIIKELQQLMICAAHK